eukprot:scaffold224986_cov17-Tisochrysis_lutea.AAC.1
MPLVPLIRAAAVFGAIAAGSVRGPDALPDPSMRKGSDDDAGGGSDAPAMPKSVAGGKGKSDPVCV